MKDVQEKVDVLIEALPYIKAFHDRIVVIKYGGSSLGNKARCIQVLEDIVFIRYVGMRPVLLHGGGHLINEKMARAGKKQEFGSNFAIRPNMVNR